MARLPKTKGFFRTALGAGITLAVIAAAAGAVVVGRDALAARVAAQPLPDPAPLVSVSVKPLVEAPGYRQTRLFVGQIEPQKTVTTSFELSGKLTSILVDEGDTVAEGQLIATQDIELLQADRAGLVSSREAIAAQLEFARQRLDRSQELRDRGFASQERLDEVIASRDELSARIREIDASLNAIAIRLEKSALYAPFTGRVTQRFVDGGEALSPGQAVVEVIKTGAPMLRVGIPLSVDETTLRGARVILNGTAYDADFDALRPDIDPVTRTRTALFSLGDAPSFAFGQTAQVAIETEVATPGTWVPLDSLKEGARGQWTLLVLNEADVVERASALVIHAESDRVYVQGSFPDGTRMIESGTQRVVTGQRVTVAPRKES